MIEHACTPSVTSTVMLRIILKIDLDVFFKIDASGEQNKQYTNDGLMRSSRLCIDNSYMHAPRSLRIL